ncbi:MAG: hypothetical protein ACE5JI_04085, partial [Acidobacteriota bacterium]
NLTHFDLSMETLDRKMQHLAEAEPDVVATGNPGCLIQIAGGMRRRGLRAEVTHPVLLLDRAYAAGDDTA